jgi:hypothetical protein
MVLAFSRWAPTKTGVDSGEVLAVPADRKFGRVADGVMVMAEYGLFVVDKKPWRWLARQGRHPSSWQKHVDRSRLH